MDITQDILAAETRIRPHLPETALAHSHLRRKYQSGCPQVGALTPS